MKIRLLEPIEGFEDEAEFRLPKRGESYIGDDGKVDIADIDSESQYDHCIVLTPCKKWRPATLKDVIDSLAGIKFPTRVRDTQISGWKDCIVLCGYRAKCDFPWLCEDAAWAQCEVLR
jgi:hypothetical protein